MEMVMVILNLMRVMQQNRKEQNTTEADSNAAGGDSQNIYWYIIIVMEMMVVSFQVWVKLLIILIMNANTEPSTEEQGDISNREP